MFSLIMPKVTFKCHTEIGVKKQENEISFLIDYNNCKSRKSRNVTDFDSTSRDC